MRQFILLMSCAVMLTGGPVPAWAQKSTLEEVKERGVVKAGVRNDIPHFGFVDEKGKLVGFEVDLSEEIAKRLGVKVELVPVTAQSRIPLLQQKRVDMLVASLSHYRKRDEVIDFSIAYMRSPQTLLVKKGTVKSIDDLVGKRFGADIGAGMVKFFPTVQPKAIIQTFQGWPEAFLALQQGTVDAIGTDVLVLAGLRSKAPKPDDYEVLGKEGTFAASDYGIGVRENDSKWRDQINFTLQDIWLDGTWDKLFEKWIGEKSALKLSKALLGFEMIVWRD